MLRLIVLMWEKKRSDAEGMSSNELRMIIMLYCILFSFNSWNDIIELLGQSVYLRD